MASEQEKSISIEPATAPSAHSHLVNGMSDWDGFIEGVPLVAYWLLLKARWRMIVLAAAAAAASTFLITQFIMAPSYRATAVLRPLGPESGVGKLNGTMGLLSSSGLGGSGILGGGAQNDQAQEYMSMLRSYAFTIAVVNTYHLEPVISREEGGRLTRWSLYRALGSRFDCEYDRIAGNMTLHFVDRDPASAQRMLGQYVDSLREKLRRREIQSATAAKASLEQAARTTPDLLLQEKLYELMARQVERENLAQVEADFAFLVIEPPVVSENRYGPRVSRDSAIVGALAMLLIAAAVIAHASWTRSLRQYHRVVASRRTDPSGHPAPASPG